MTVLAGWARRWAQCATVVFDRSPLRPPTRLPRARNRPPGVRNPPPGARNGPPGARDAPPRHFTNLKITWRGVSGHLFQKTSLLLASSQSPLSLSLAESIPRRPESAPSGPQELGIDSKGDRNRPPEARNQSPGVWKRPPRSPGPESAPVSSPRSAIRWKRPAGCQE